MNQWEQGVLMAASVLIACHDQPTMAADVLHELGLSNADCSDLDDFDKENLRKAQGERGKIKLRGLGRRKTANVKLTGAAPAGD